MINDQGRMTLVMPKLGLTMTEGTLAKWLKGPGEAVRQGESLFEFESEKSVMEFEAPVEGVLVEILVAEGQTVPCGTPVARLEPHAQPLPDFREGRQRDVVATPAAKRRARELGVELAGVAGRGPEGRVHVADVEALVRLEGVQKPLGAAEAPIREAITPVARKLASDMELDWTRLSGSGLRGRVVKEDVLKAGQRQAETSGVSPKFRAQPLAGFRKVVARRVAESAFTAPHVTLFSEADASSLVEARSQLNTELAARPETASLKISYNTLLVAIVARALRDHPQLNACIVGEEIHYYEDINVALAVDTERGLLVPVIRQADRLDLVVIQQRSEALIEAALAGQVSPEDLSGGTFTLSNLGMFEIDGFTPIINQPQAAILGVGRIAAKAVAVEGEVRVRQMITLSLSFDHRIVDGAPAARFLQRVKGLVERPFALAIPARRA